MQTKMTGTQDTKDVQEQLRLNRLEWRWEMQRALMCISDKEKRALAAEWKHYYDEDKYKMLILCAKNKKVCYQIAHWDIDHFRSTSKWNLT